MSESVHSDEITDQSKRVPRKGVLSRLRPTRGATVPAQINDIVRLVRAQHPKSDTRAIVRAFELAQVVHEGQHRKSGEDFIQHPIGVARILAEQGMDDTSIIAAFLHDAVEDTELTIPEVAEAFGSEVGELIDGLTKIEKIQFRSTEQERADNFRKMIVAMAKDLRVLIIKLADRLHNMRTIEALDPAKRELVATETLEIYAPLAHRLAMQQIKGELEDLSFKTLFPKRYEEIEQLVAQRQPQREEYLKHVISKVYEKLREIKVKADVTGRHKHYYSIYEKMIAEERDFGEILDLVGIRVIVENIRDCWAALGAVHSVWTPVPGRFRDYIATPKFNLYQSLHTTVVGPEGKPLEIQIRTRQMHEVAEWGVASHWQYKEGFTHRTREEHAAWMRRMLDLEQTEDAGEFLQTLRYDLVADEVFVFTPKGDVIDLSRGATPIDFAYAIHTEVGHACVGAKVDGRLVPLDYKLSSGSTVEVMTSKSSNGPSRDWLKVVVTPRARTKIRQWFTSQRREEAVAAGKEAVAEAVKRAGFSKTVIFDGSLEAVASELKFNGLDVLYLAVGEGRTSAQTVITRLERMLKPQEKSEDEELPAAKPTRTKSPAVSSVLVKGVDEVLVKMARCCMPVPGDPILGFVTKGRGVSVHRLDCPNAKSLGNETHRLVEVSWNANATGAFLVSMRVEALDRPKLLRDVTTTVSDFGVNITSVTAASGDGIANLEFIFEVPDPSVLAKILATVRKVEAVFDAYRMTPSR